MYTGKEQYVLDSHRMLMSIREWRTWLRSKLYIPFTLATGVVTVVALSLVQSVERRPTFITFSIATCAWLALVFLETLIDVRDGWKDWLYGSTRRSVVQGRLSRSASLTTAIDLYLALCGAHALVAMAPWLFDDSADKAHYYAGFAQSSVDAIHERDPWLVYFHFLSLSFWLYNGVGFGRVQPIVAWLSAFYGALSIVGFLFFALFVAILLDRINASVATASTRPGDDDVNTAELGQAMPSSDGYYAGANGGASAFHGGGGSGLSASSVVIGGPPDSHAFVGAPSHQQQQHHYSHHHQYYPHHQQQQQPQQPHGFNADTAPTRVHYSSAIHGQPSWQ